ncbi:putative fmn binding protein [Lasiodiplodia theobromae]|nr:putative fmn binding protein [Lasiodiplodia theobromae]
MDLTISKPLTLNCGLVLPNRLVKVRPPHSRHSSTQITDKDPTKAAMAEQMSSKCRNYLPNEAVDAVYQTWARGGWGMVLTVLSTWKRWAQTYNTAAAATSSPPPLIMQLNHPGRQSPVGAGARSLCAQNLAPSAIPLDMGDGWLAKSVVSMVFGTPKAMGEDEISAVVGRFAMAARLAAEAGFAGVEVHAAHGYLLSTFLTAKSNERTDGYGGSARNRARIVVEVVEAIQKATESKKGFCVGVKLNSADHQTAEALRDSIEQIEAISEAGIDFLEISGGSYEDPRMMADAGESDTPDVKVSSRTAAREAFFLDFAKSIRDQFPSLHLMVTGGFRTRAGMEAAVADSACDLVGVGRPAVLQPSAPRDIIFNRELSDQDARLSEHKIDVPRLAKLSGIRGVGSGATSAWYSGQIQRLAKVK